MIGVLFGAAASAGIVIPPIFVPSSSTSKNEQTNQKVMTKGNTTDPKDINGNAVDNKDPSKTSPKIVPVPKTALEEFKSTINKKLDLKEEWLKKLNDITNLGIKKVIYTNTIGDNSEETITLKFKTTSGSAIGPIGLMPNQDVKLVFVCLTKTSTISILVNEIKVSPNSDDNNDPVKGLFNLAKEMFNINSLSLDTSQDNLKQPGPKEPFTEEHNPTSILTPKVAAPQVPTPKPTTPVPTQPKPIHNPPSSTSWVQVSNTIIIVSKELPAQKPIAPPTHTTPKPATQNPIPPTHTMPKPTTQKPLPPTHTTPKPSSPKTPASVTPPSGSTKVQPQVPNTPSPTTITQHTSTTSNELHKFTQALLNKLNGAINMGARTATYKNNGGIVTINFKATIGGSIDFIGTNFNEEITIVIEPSKQSSSDLVVTVNKMKVNNKDPKIIKLIEDVYKEIIK